MTTPAKKTPAAKATPVKKATAQKATPKAATPKAAEPKATPVAKATPAPAAAEKPAPQAAPAEEVKAEPVAEKVPAPKPAPKAEPKVETTDDAVAAYEAKLEQMTTQFTEGYNEMMDFGKEQFEKFFKVEGVDFFKSYDEAMAFNKENVEAFVKSSSIASKGVQDVASLVAELTKASFEGNVEASKKLFECKTPQEAVELQQSLAKEGFDKLVADANRISEVSSKIAEEAVKPLKARYEASVELVNSKAA